MVDDHEPHYPSYVSDFEPNEEAPIRHRNPVAPYQLRTNDPDRSLPLFLSDHDGEVDPSEYMPPARQRRGSYITSRILAGVMGCAAIAVLVALVSSDSAREFIASAKASTTAALSAASAAMQPNSTQPKTSDVQPTQAARENQAPDPRMVAVAAVTPTREDIKTAYQTALQSNAPQAAAVPEPTIPEDSIRHLEPGEIASLLKRADALIATGDVAAARLVLRRAAEAGDGRAAMKLGGTYDPTVLEKLGVHGVVPDLVMARSWYEKARRFGAPEAAAQLDLLANRQR